MPATIGRRSNVGCAFEFFALVVRCREGSPKCAATSSTKAWLTRLDLPDPKRR